MTDESRSRVEEIMAKALAELAAVVAEDTGQEQPMCTNYVLVAEWSTLSGQMWATRWWDEQRPPWQRDGLLNHALHGCWHDD